MNLLSNKTVGVAGCGAMGLPMAENMLKAGYDVWGYDVRPVDANETLKNRIIADPNVFAERSDIVISVVRDIPESNALLFDEQAILMQADPPGTVILSSTLPPNYIIEVRDRAPQGTRVIDAPMSGAPYRARDASLTFMIGGDPDVIQSVMPLFEAMGENVHHLGPVGAGAACKVANNLCAAASVVAVRRALKAASAYGIAADKLLQVMRTSSGSTWYGDNINEIDWAHEGYDPANTMGILEKDVMSFVAAIEKTQSISPSDFEAAIVTALKNMDPMS